MAIGNTAANARNSKNVISNANKPYVNSVTSVSSAWKGEIGEAYKNFNRGIKSSINKTISKFDSLGSKLEELDRSVNKAEKAEARNAAMNQ